MREDKEINNIALQKYNIKRTKTSKKKKKTQKQTLTKKWCSIHPVIPRNFHQISYLHKVDFMSQV